MIEEWEVLHDKVMDQLYELRTQEEYVAALGDEVPEVNGRVEHEILDSQAYLNKSIEALDRAFSIIEGMLD